MQYRIETEREFAIELPKSNCEPRSPPEQRGDKWLLLLSRSAKESTANKAQREDPARQARPIGIE